MDFGRLKKWLIWGAMAAFLVWCMIGFRRDIAQIDLHMLEPAWPAIAAAPGLSLFNYVLRIWRWPWYLRHQGHVLPVGFVSLTFMAGFAFTLSPGKLGEMARARYYQAHGVPLSAVSGAFFVEAVNGTSVVSLMTLAGEQLAAQGNGCIAVISSVAGDRGRQSNYVYGSAKALVSAFASGQRQRLRKVGVNVLTIKPGFVDTPMTASFKKGALWAKPEKVASDILAGVDQGKSVVYTPGFLRVIMLIIKHVPEFVFVKLAL